MSRDLESSPRPWGCFPFWCHLRRGSRVFPTPVGVFLDLATSRLMCRQSSPRPWGCFRSGRRAAGVLHVFPTPVGVFPYSFKNRDRGYRLPHARGGVSEFVGQLAVISPSSPRPWGCFWIAKPVSEWKQVFPTPVGVFLKRRFGYRSRRGLPHARGGVSSSSSVVFVCDASSPRPWGCFSRWRCSDLVRRVFPTPVGVFLLSSDQIEMKSRLPHARGGVSPHG